MKLTNLTIKSLKSTGTRREVSISGRPGLRVRVSATGEHKSWVYVYRQGGVLKRLTIGDCNDYSIARITETHGRMHRLALDGDDPAKALPERRSLARKANGVTVRDVAEDYRERYLIPHIDTADEVWRLISTDVLPVWGQRQVDTIVAFDVTQLLDEILDRGSPRVAERVRSTVRQMFAHGNKRGMTTNFPFAAVGPIESKKQKRNRKKPGRALEADEIRKFWNKLDSAKMLPRLRHAYKLLLVTGQRRSEVVKAAWHEFDLQGGTWTLSKERTKSRRAHLVPLSPLALEVLEDLKATLAEAKGGKLPYEGPWLFPSPRWSSDTHIDPKAITRGISRNRTHWDIPRFAVHDLRRTVRSNMPPLGIDKVVAQKIVNHKQGGMDDVYDVYEYLDEKRAALNLWAKRLQELLAAGE